MKMHLLFQIRLDLFFPCLMLTVLQSFKKFIFFRNNNNNDFNDNNNNVSGFCSSSSLEKGLSKKWFSTKILGIPRSTSETSKVIK